MNQLKKAGGLGAEQLQEAIGDMVAKPSAAERLFAISKPKILNFSVKFLKIVIILFRRAIDNKLLSVSVCSYQSKNAWI